MVNGDQLFDTPSQTQRRSGRYILIFVILLIVIIASVGAYQYLSSQQKSKDNGEMTPTPTEFVFPTDTPTPMATPTGKLTPVKSTPTPRSSPTPRPAGSTIDKSTGLDRSKLTIEVLNGSGTAGVAKKASDKLTELGYQVSSTGNADNFDHETTIIEVKNTKSNYLPLLKTDLSTSYTIVEASSSLSASSSADARVIVGKK